MIVDKDKMLRGKSKLTIERTQDFLGGTPLDERIFTAIGTATYNGLDLELSDNPCGIATCPFDMNKITIAEFELGNIYAENDAILSLELLSESDLYGIMVTSTDTVSSETKLKIKNNGNVGSLSVLLPKHNISAQTGKYYTVSVRIDKNLYRLTVLSGGQELGYKTLSVTMLNSLGASFFKASWTNPVRIGQTKLKLWY